MFSPKSKPKSKLTHEKDDQEGADDFPTYEPTSSPRPLTASPSTMNSRSNGMNHQDAKLQPRFSSDSPVRPSSSTLNGAHDIPRRVASIRPVSSFENVRPATSIATDYSSTDASPSLTNGRSASVLSSSPQSNASANNTSPTMGRRPTQESVSDKNPIGRLNPKRSTQFISETPIHEARQRSNSPQARLRPTGGGVDVPQRQSSIGQVSKPNGETQEDGTPTEGQNGWDSTVGKAGLGKTGRVINRLVSENEALKRDIKLEKIKADDSRSSARLLEDKMERLVADYESRLLEANVHKTLLARKERQVETLQQAVDLERKRTLDAQGKEKTWREEMEKIRSETTREVEEATTQAALFEGRYTAISSHWKDQGDEVKRVVAKMTKDITNLVEERKKDDEKITTLRDLCDQQDGNMKELREQKDEIAQRFEDYKAEQERALGEIKTKAAQREADQERLLEDTKEVLDKLRWALNLKNNVAWAG